MVFVGGNILTALLDSAITYRNFTPFLGGFYGPWRNYFLAPCSLEIHR